MSFLELAKKRYSVRAYQAKKVEEEKVNAILEAGRVAPTACNYQPQRLVVVQSEEGLNKLSRAANIFGAPLVVIVCADTTKAWVRPTDKKNHADIDATIVTDHMMHEATEQGLGSLWVCYFDAEMIKREFNLPKGVEPVNLLCMGYAEGTPLSADRHSKLRKPLTETVSYERM
ncbi:nitroreductase family protein [Acetanaerobacterium elongatum]|uniref:Nitroreductase n=1 Tax=Acetanaerobacterium elongatum TaxID=258515 RepID=A0A1H0EIJ8_9FIRM|nr:nitroreductase family protein [Acetanaerobacterium elongatum]SDN82307.1 Nitroreductase [Acetanaerobacterium elongatum]